jgi:PAS domain-containing protein
MFSNLLDNPTLLRHLVEDLPLGIYIVDREQCIGFWNHGAEHITGHRAHEVVGHVLEAVVQACDRQGNRFSGEQRRPGQCGAATIGILRHDQISRVRGFADQGLRNINTKDPLDRSNRRVSIIVLYLNNNPDDAESPAAGAKGSGEGKPSAGAPVESETTSKKTDK